MRIPQIAGLVALGLAALSAKGAQVHLTSAFSFDTDFSGTAIAGVVWDTNPGYYWELFIASGSPGGVPNGLTNPILNPGGTIDIPLSLGDNTFTLFGEQAWIGAWQGLNLSFDGHIPPDISAMAPTGYPGSIPSPNSSNFTPWNTLDYRPGSGSLLYSSGDIRVTLTDFFWAGTQFGVDRVWAHGPQFNGWLDDVGGFTLRVEQVGVPDGGSSTGLLMLGGLAGCAICRRKS